MATRVAKLLEAVTDPSTKAAHSELCFKYAKEAAHNAMRLAPFAVSDTEAITLERMGITTSPFATTSHTHASDKILENDCLAIIGHYLPKEPVTFIQLKKGKLHLLNRSPKQDILANYCHEPKDVLRYGITNPHHCPRVDTNTAVIADTLHFMSTRQLNHLFSQNPALNTLFATLVLPVEALHRLPSLFPEVYRIEYYESHFAYMPGGHGGGAYVHSYETLKWLSTGQIGCTRVNPRSGTTHYISIEKIETKGAHHIMLITRRKAQCPWPLPPLWVFHPSDYVKLPPVFYPPDANVRNTYPHDLIKRMQAYCFSVKAVSLRDIFAKLRQVIETAELKRYSMADLIRLANYLLLITGMEQVSDYECLLTKGWLAKLSARIRIRVKQLFESLRGKSSYAALLTVTDVIPVPFTTKPCARGIDGISWLIPSAPENSNPSHDTGPTLEDLDLIADLHKQQHALSDPDSEPADDSGPSHPNDDTAESKSEDRPPHDNNATQPDTHFPEHPKSTTHKAQRKPKPNAWSYAEGWNDDTHPATSDSEYDWEDTGSLFSTFEEPCCRSEPVTSTSGTKFEDHQTQNHTQQDAGADTSFPDVESDMFETQSADLDAPQPQTSTFGSFTPDMPHNPNEVENVQTFNFGSFTPDLLRSTGFQLDRADTRMTNKGKRPVEDNEAHILPPPAPPTPDHTAPENPRPPRVPKPCDPTAAQTSRETLSTGAQPTGHVDSQIRTVAAAYPHLTPKQVAILHTHGFTNLKQQHSGSGPIEPIFENPNTSMLDEATPSTNNQRLIAVLAASLHRKVYTYGINNARGSAYMSDVKNNLTGLVLPKLNRETLAAWVSLCENATRQVNLLVIHGAGGAGKSRCLQNLILNNPDLANDINVITPTVNLVQDWRKKNPQVDPRRFITFEKACEREGREIAIFDDYGKLPAGYIDAYLAIKPTVDMVILTGDQRQSTYHCANRDAQTANLQTNVAYFRRYCDYYINATHRQPRRLANPIEVHAENESGGAIRHAALIPEGCTALVPSHRTQTVLADLGRTTYTYSGCQGLTLPNVTIVLDSDTPLCSPEVLYTAFSRASSTITFVNTHSDHPKFLEKLDATPYLKTLISGVREDENAGADHAPAEHKPPTPNVKTHLPVENDATFLEPKIEAMMDKDTRELWDGQEKTNLMQTQDPVVQLFPHQQAKDEALFRITIDKRIRTASVDENTKAIIGRLHAGDLLFEAYAKFMRVPKEAQTFDPELWRHCRQLALRTYLSKPKANLVQGSARQDPDFPENAIALFNKSQWVKKLEKVGFKFKAGQTISAFKQSTVLLTTTMALYLRKKREQHQPENVFIMCEKTPSDFNDFVINRWDFSGESYTSDYEQYDQSQDASFLNFELRKAKHLGVPDHVLEFYRFIKTHARTFVGNLAIMRLSGEGPTFDANTECNIAYDALRFNLDNTVNACYAGDDLVRDKVCPERPSWCFSQHLFTLTAKPQRTTKPDFCGWRLSPYGIVKNPTQLYQSLQLAIHLNKMEDVKRSYAIDYTHAYKLQDRLFEIFDEKEMAAHHLTTRLLIKHGVTNAHTGDHLPMFHITSDRLIQNPDLITTTDSSGTRSITPNISITDDHFSTDMPGDRAGERRTFTPIVGRPKTFPRLIWLDGTPLD